jgi:hypothetical protein
MINDNAVKAIRTAADNKGNYSMINDNPPASRETGAWIIHKVV